MNKGWIFNAALYQNALGSVLNTLNGEIKKQPTHSCKNIWENFWLWFFVCFCFHELKGTIKKDYEEVK